MMPMQPLVSLERADMYGRPMKGCPHMAEWFPVFQRLCIARGIIRESLDVWQAAGNAEASAGTHDWGDCLDTNPYDDEFVELAREGGARATWQRIKKFGWKGAQHAHLKLSCPCQSPAAYQTTAVDAGFNGLGYLGRGGRDYHPAPKTRRDYRAGITWMQQQITTLEENMPLSDADVTRIAEAFKKTVNAVDLANQRRIDALAATVDEVKRIVTENQTRLGYQAKSVTISDQITRIKEG